MLVLTSSVGQYVMIGDNIKIELMNIDSGWVVVELTVDGNVSREIMQNGDIVDLDDGVHIEAVQVKLLNVRMGYKAPRNVPILRDVIYESKK